MKNRIVFIGNSIVNGFPMNRGRSFPGLIRADVKAGKTPFAADVVNKGVNGETTMDILRRFDHDVIDLEPAVVCIMTGTNDLIYGEAGPSECMEHLEEMAARARSHGIAPVFMTPLPVDAEKASRRWMAGLGIDYDGINRQIGELGELIRGSASLCMDVCKGWREHLDELERTGDAYIDGVHPNPEGYRLLADIVTAWIGEHVEALGLK